MLIPAFLALSLVPLSPAGELSKALTETKGTSAPEAYSGPPLSGQGGQVRGNITYQWRIMPRLEPTGDYELVGLDQCSNDCQGPPPKHHGHAQCNRSCDAPCKKPHTLHVADTLEFFSVDRAGDLGETLTKVFETSKSRGIEFSGIPDQIGGGATIDVFVARADLPENVSAMTIEATHAVTNPYQPCAVHLRQYRRQDYLVMALVEVAAKFDGVLVADGSAFKSEENIIREEVVLGGLSAFEPTPKESDSIVCRCEPAAEEPESHGWIPSFWKDQTPLPVGQITGDYAFSQLGTYGRNEKVEIGVTGLDLNETQFEISQGWSGWLPAGTRLVPDNNKVQEVIVRDGTWIGPPMMWDSNLNGGTADLKTIKTLCAEMQKQEPNSNVRFRVAAPKDFTLSYLAEKASRARSRGPWDQARMWIYTDRATYAQIKAKLIPAPRLGQYRDALYDVAMAVHGRPDRKDLDKLLQPEMLADPGLNARALDWAVQVLMKRDRAKAISAIKAGSPNLWAVSSVGVSHVRDLVAALSGRSEADAVPSIEAALMSATPAQQREEVKAASTLRPILWWKYAGGPRKAAYLRIAEAYKL